MSLAYFTSRHRYCASWNRRTRRMSSVLQETAVSAPRPPARSRPPHPRRAYLFPENMGPKITWGQTTGVSGREHSPAGAPRGQPGAPAWPPPPRPAPRPAPGRPRWLRQPRQPPPRCGLTLRGPAQPGHPGPVPGSARAGGWASRGGRRAPSGSSWLHRTRRPRARLPAAEPRPPIRGGLMPTRRCAGQWEEGSRRRAGQ